MYPLRRFSTLLKEDRIADLRKCLEDERRGNTNHHVSQRVNVRQNVTSASKRGKRVSTHLKKTSTINRAGHPIMHRKVNRNQGLRARTSNAKMMTQYDHSRGGFSWQIRKTVRRLLVLFGISQTKKNCRLKQQKCHQQFLMSLSNYTGVYVTNTSAVSFFFFMPNTPLSLNPMECTKKGQVIDCHKVFGSLIH